MGSRREGDGERWRGKGEGGGGGGGGRTPTPDADVPNISLSDLEAGISRHNEGLPNPSVQYHYDVRWVKFQGDLNSSPMMPRSCL